MLSVLKIENIAIIESAEIEFSNGFNVLSGETGAGKSIILDSINAVLGFRTSRELIRTGASEAQVTALFSDVSADVESYLEKLGIPVSDDKALVVSRVIGQDRNVCRINNALTNVSVLRELGSHLISIHGQQDNRELLNNETHIGYIDSMVEEQSLFSAYSEVFGRLSELKRQIKALSGDKAEKARRMDILAFQIDELEKADIVEGEWERLKARRTELQNFEKIQQAVSGAYSALNGGDNFSGSVEMVSGAVKELASASAFSAELQGYYERLNDIYYELEDVADSLRSSFNEDGFSGAELEELENRLDLLYKLSKKYGESEAEMLSYLENARLELSDISFSDERLDELKAEFEKVYVEAQELAELISEKRRETAEAFSEKVCNELSFLDMPNVKFLVEFGKKELSEDGIDTAEFYISANLGELPKPMAKIASGGELSRIMLALKTVMADKDKIPTMIFDEIDSGVSGRAAVKVAAKLKNVSIGKQVLCVTHLAQLMAYADSHYLIEKEVSGGKTYTRVTSLDMLGRKREIARITGGGEITDIQLRNAEEMINNAGEKI